MTAVIPGFDHGDRLGSGPQALLVKVEASVPGKYTCLPERGTRTQIPSEWIGSKIQEARKPKSFRASHCVVIPPNYFMTG